jgi:hypothetical protein
MINTRLQSSANELDADAGQVTEHYPLLVRDGTGGVNLVPVPIVFTRRFEVESSRRCWRQRLGHEEEYSVTESLVVNLNNVIDKSWTSIPTIYENWQRNL